MLRHPTLRQHCVPRTATIVRAKMCGRYNVAGGRVATDDSDHHDECAVGPSSTFGWQASLTDLAYALLGPGLLRLNISKV